MLATSTTTKGRKPNRKLVFRDRSQWIKITVPAIIPPEIFEAVQERLKENKEHMRKRPKRFFLLSGMVVCSECNYAYSATRSNKSQAYRHRVKYGHCCNKTIVSSKIEPKVWKAVTEILLDPKSLRRGYEKMMEEERQKESRNLKHLEVLKASIEKLLNKKSRLTKTYLDPEMEMSKEEYLAEKRLIDEELRTTEAEIEVIEKQLSHVPSESDLVALEEMAATFTEALGANLDIPDTEKRRILELLNIKVLVSPDGKIKLTGFFVPRRKEYSPTCENDS